MVSQPKLQLQLEFNVNNCLQLHLFICTPFAQLSPLPCPTCLPTVTLMVLSPVDAADDAMMMMRCLCLCQTVGHWFWLATMSIGFALIRISFMHATWPRLLFYFISFHFIRVFSFARPLYYDYHVLFNN